MPTRRHVMAAALGLAADFALNRKSFASEATEPIALRIDNVAPVSIAEEFTGLGYEMSSVARTGLLSADNSMYVTLVKGLGVKGIMRVGGIVADYTRFEPHGTSKAEPHDTVITETNLQQFAEFLKQTGWRAIWSLNFAQGSLPEAIAEAKAVASVLGSHLAAFELGNEVENYSNGKQPFRTSWSYAAFRKQYREWWAAITRAVPSAPFAAPDTASSVEWVEETAQDAAGDVQLLTTHYYRNNQSHGSAEQLLTTDFHLLETLTRLRSASSRSRIPWRMCETNSFSGGGLPGVSDTIVGALWTLDFMLLLASYGSSGVNIETGFNQLGFLSSYSPIRNDADGKTSVGVPYYGMLAFASACRHCTQILPVTGNFAGTNATAYALGYGGKVTTVVLVNRNRTELAVDLRKLAIRNAAIHRLAAAQGGDTTQVTFGAAAVNSGGNWLPGTMEHIRNGFVTIPALSAAVISAT